MFIVRGKLVLVYRGTVGGGLSLGKSRVERAGKEG